MKKGQKINFQRHLLIIKDINGNIVRRELCPSKKFAIDSLQDYWNQANETGVYFRWDIQKKE